MSKVSRRSINMPFRWHDFLTSMKGVCFVGDKGIQRQSGLP